MMRNGKLTTNEGGVFEWEKDYFEINEILFKSTIGNELHSSDCTDKIAWGKKSDYNDFNDTILKNIAIIVNHYPETEKQILQFIKGC